MLCSCFNCSDREIETERLFTSVFMCIRYMPAKRRTGSWIFSCFQDRSLRVRNRLQSMLLILLPAPSVKSTEAVKGGNNAFTSGQPASTQRATAADPCLVGAPSTLGPETLNIYPYYFGVKSIFLVIIIVECSILQNPNPMTQGCSDTMIQHAAMPIGH